MLLSVSDNWAPPTRFLGLLLALFVVNLFLLNGYISLWDDDEAAYAGFALRMLETGDWVNPQFTWAEVHRKTPFHFWSIAISYLIFGVNEFAVRFPSVLAVFLTCLITWKWSTPLVGKARAAWGVLIFSTSFLVLSMGKMSLTDAWLMFFDTAAVLALFNFLQNPRWYWNLAFWGAISMGILVKGPPIIILCGGIWLGLAVFHSKRKLLISTHPWFFGPIALLPFGAWAYLSWQSDGGALLTFLYEWYVVKRVGGSVFGQTGLPGYHLLVAILAFICWLPFLLKGLWYNFRYFRKNDLTLSIGLWLVFAWVFYELMSSKLPSYAMGAHPAFALLIADSMLGYLEQKGKTNLKLPKTLAIIAALLISLVWGIGGYWIEQSPAKASPRLVAAFRADFVKDKSPAEKVFLVGFSARQLRMSFPFYIERSFGHVQEATPEEAIERLRNNEPIALFLGEDAMYILRHELVTNPALAHYEFKELEWWSLNDKMKMHPFGYAYPKNIEQ